MWAALIALVEMFPVLTPFPKNTIDVINDGQSKYSELSNKHGVFLILFERIFPTTCLIRTSTFINF